MRVGIPVGTGLAFIGGWVKCLTFLTVDALGTTD